MPIKQCSDKDGKPGFKYGDSGHCYTYTPGDEASKKAAKSKAVKQGQAIEISKHASANEQLNEDVKKYFK